MQIVIIVDDAKRYGDGWKCIVGDTGRIVSVSHSVGGKAIPDWLRSDDEKHYTCPLRMLGKIPDIGDFIGIMPLFLHRELNAQLAQVPFIVE